MVPHGVRWTGSQDLVPVRIVCDAPVAMLILTRPGSAGPLSLQVISHSGSLSLGHSADMSRTSGATPCVTTRASRLLAIVARRRGSALASSAVIERVDDWDSVPSTPYSSMDLDLRPFSTN